MTATLLTVPATGHANGAEVTCAHCGERYFLALAPDVLQTVVAALAAMHSCEPKHRADLRGLFAPEPGDYGGAS